MSNLGQFVSYVLFFIDAYLVPLIFGIAFIVFLWGVFQYFIAGGANDEKRKEGRSFILYGIIGFVVMMSIWGIVNLFYYSLGFNNGVRPPLPCFTSSCAGGGGGGMFGVQTAEGTTPGSGFYVISHPTTQWSWFGSHQ